MLVKIKNTDLQNYCKRNLPECYEPLDDCKDYTLQKEIDLEYSKLIRNTLKIY